jgi:hypothetical protein
MRKPGTCDSASPRRGSAHRRIFPTRSRSCNGSRRWPAQRSASRRTRAVVERKAATGLDADLLRLASLSYAARTGGDGDNFVLRRGALLHGDVAMLVMRTAVEPVSTSRSLGPQRFRMQLSDGRQTDFGQQAVHWEIARMVLDHVSQAARMRRPGRTT